MTRGPVVVLGGTGWAGGVFVRALEARRLEHVVLSRKSVRYDRFGVLRDALEGLKPSFLINAAGFSGKPNVDACEDTRGETLRGNVTLPLTVAHACEVTRTPWGHVSSGCIYSGAKLGGVVHRDLLAPEAQALLAAGSPIEGFTEDDPPNFSFDAPPCSFYSGSKALGEAVLGGAPSLYVWRIRLPFDEHHGPRNLLSKLLAYPRLYQNLNSLSHLGQAVDAALELWLSGAPFGTYNLVNPGFVSTREIAALLEEHLVPGRSFEFFESDTEFYAQGARALRSNCVLSADKALAAGAKLAPVREALTDALTRWDGPR